MWRRRLKCALFIDFDNIFPLLKNEFVASIPNWLAWLEDGQFDEKKRRRAFPERRVYWNSQYERHRATFEEHGFDATSCVSRVKMNKSAADMMIALDALEMSYEKSEIEEYVFLTTDTDFIPLLDRLSDLEKRTVSAANEENLSFVIYSDHADDVIGLVRFADAMKYNRPPNWYAKLGRPRAAVTANLKPAKTANKPETQSGEPSSAPPAKPAANLALLARAADHLAEAGKATPNLMISRKTVTVTLSEKMPEFRVAGLSPFLGCRNYNAMLEQIAKQRPDLQLHNYPNGGRAISYRAKENA